MKRRMNTECSYIMSYGLEGTPCAKEAVKEFWKARGIDPPLWTHPKPRKRKTVLPASRASARIPHNSQKLLEQVQGLAYS